MNTTMPNVEPNGRYDSNQTSEYLGIHRDTLYKYTHVTKDIECGYRHVGGRKRKFYLGSEILRFWNACVEQSNSAHHGT